MEKQIVLNIIIDNLHYILLFIEDFFTKLIIKTFYIAIILVADDESRRLLLTLLITFRTQPLIQISFDRGPYLFDFHCRLRVFGPFMAISRYAIFRLWFIVILAILYLICYQILLAININSLIIKLIRYPSQNLL